MCRGADERGGGFDSLELPCHELIGCPWALLLGESMVTEVSSCSRASAKSIWRTLYRIVDEKNFNVIACHQVSHITRRGNAGGGGTRRRWSSSCSQ